MRAVAGEPLVPASIDVVVPRIAAAKQRDDAGDHPADERRDSPQRDESEDHEERVAYRAARSVSVPADELPAPRTPPTRGLALP